MTPLAFLLGRPLVNYAKDLVREVIEVGRAGTLIDWEGDVESRAYVSLYSAESILNWRVERVNGRNIPALIALHEVLADGHFPDGHFADGHSADGHSADGHFAHGIAGESDDFESRPAEQIRVLRLVPTEGEQPGMQGTKCIVEIWRPKTVDGGSLRVDGRKKEWELVETRIPLRVGRPLPLLPFVFHGATHSQPAVGKLPLSDIIAVNLDHYRLDADYKHGIHYTALPTAWVSGFGKDAQLRIGSSIAWTAEVPGASAGFLEFTGQGLTTFERAMDRDERLLAILGSRLLESQKRVGETAEAIELRQGGENSILGSIAGNVSASLTQVLRWVYWWNSTEAFPDDVTTEQVSIELNTDFSTKGLSAQEITSIVAAWQAGAISRDTMTELFRRGKVLPEGRTLEEEERLIGASALPQGG